MTEKINIGLLFGGRSCEHEVSVTSATSIVNAIDRDKYHVHLIGIDKSGRWHLGRDMQSLVHENAVATADQLQQQNTREVSLAIHHHGNLAAAAEPISAPPKLDVVFPILHGTFGEDGTLQGVLEMSGLPYVGCGVAASALAMDKALAKQAFAAAGLPQTPYLVYTASAWNDQSNDMRNNIIGEIEQKLQRPWFIKPANLGSSVGIGKANDRDSLVSCIEQALQFDNKIVIEQGLENCHEIECSILGNETPQASIPGEIIPAADFYDYHAKYIDDQSQLVVPAALDDKTTAAVQRLAIEAFKAIDGRGLARVDFFVQRDSMEITLSEINTMPGFTPISMYPRLWAASGIDYAQLIDRLVDLAIDHHRNRQHLRHAF